MKKAVLCLLFLLNLLPIPATSGQQQTTRAPGWMIEVIKKHAKEYQVEPEFIAAVCAMESNFRCGPLGKRGKYVGPGGIYCKFVARWNIYDPVENLRVVALSLQNTHSDAAKIKRLKRYNMVWWENNYLRDVMKTYRQYKRQGMFMEARIM